MFTILGIEVMIGNLLAEFSNIGKVLSETSSLLVLDAMANSIILGTELLEILSISWHVVGSVFHDVSDVFEAMIETENGIVEELFLVGHVWGILINDVLIEIHLKSVSEFSEVIDHLCEVFNFKFW